MIQEEIAAYFIACFLFIFLGPYHSQNPVIVNASKASPEMEE